MMVLSRQFDQLNGRSLDAREPSYREARTVVGLETLSGTFVVGGNLVPSVPFGIEGRRISWRCIRFDTFWLWRRS
jgi:hypothetical protein